MNTTMNTVNQTFDWTRFTHTLRKEVVENKRAILFTILGIYGLLTLIMIVGNVTSGTGGLNMVNDVVAEKTPQRTVVGILGFAIMITASLSFKGLTTKAGRVNMFSSPSSMLEKFLANISIYIIGFIVVFFICAQLADLTRIAALSFFEEADFVVPGPINFLDIWNVPSGNIPFATLQKGMSYSLVLGVFASAGLYLLGSVLWPRLSLLKTFAAINVIQFSLMLIIMPMFAVGFNKQDFALSIFEYFSTDNNFAVFIISLSIFQAVLFFGLAWYLFKHKDVISLKWWK